MHWISYTIWLIGQVIASASKVAIDTVRINNTQDPIIVNYPVRVTGEWERTLFSTSITMTPGTLSVGFRPVETIDGAESESGYILLVQAVYGSDPAEVVADLAHMEEKLAPRVADTPLHFSAWMYAGNVGDGYRNDIDFPLAELDENSAKSKEQKRVDRVKQARIEAAKRQQQQKGDKK